ncbi:MAG: amylo-alpha-1,6-glucosidase [Ktedonobacteraceae bacterium]|nr:amylo-alpha-1,6-glucosidase [Ktedonobacteraceae bacterium]
MKVEAVDKQLTTAQAGEIEDRPDPRASGITQITLKSGDAFLIADGRGDFHPAKREMGLFWHGTRFLRTCDLSLKDCPLAVLSHHIASLGDACQVDLTNTPFTDASGVEVAHGEIYICRQLELQSDQFIQTFTLTSFHTDPLTLTLNLHIGADFRDMFEVRGAVREGRGMVFPPVLNDDVLLLSYQGLDNVQRETEILLTPSAAHVSADQISWQVTLTRAQPVEILLRVKVRASDEKLLIPEEFAAAGELAQPTIQTSDSLLNRLLMRGQHDLLMLSTLTPHGHYPYAGIPWFSCPFGRDGLITCLQFMPWFPQVARGTLAFLAAHQGTKVEPFTDEQPGKILHEMRRGEMANRREIPYIPYYGSIDVTPLFIITLEHYIRWTDDLSFLQQLWPHAEAAARWMQEYGDKDGDMFLEYETASEKGLGNQGWKDAWDSVSSSDGRLAVHPIALCEVQAYAYAAYQAMGYLATRLGKPQEAVRWEQLATELRERFLERFWWEEEQVFYLALDGRKRPCDVVTSNPGQCLWTGIVPQEKAQKIIDRLMREDMYSGWGIRTLSTGAARYNPMSYHNGSVWPHDTAIVGAGFARYGGKAQAGQLLHSMLETSYYYEGARLPELHCGFPKRPGYGPTRYPVACSPQAWAAGAPFMLLNALLGLEPDAEHQRLVLRQPTLPGWLQSIEIQGLWLGPHQVHLHLERAGNQTAISAGKENTAEIVVQ